MSFKHLGHAHGEAFCLMSYRCDHCGRRERIWNSRDGVTPFGVSCPDCTAESLKGPRVMTHVEFSLDVYAPHHKPYLGQRVFRDGTQDEARQIIVERLERCRGTKYEVPLDQWQEVIDSAVGVTEFLPGWPHIYAHGTTS